MSITTIGPSYYRSFASYEVPFHPDDPIEFCDTAGLRSFYVAYHDLDGRVVRFDKIQLVRATTDPQEFALSVAQQPGATVYFAVGRELMNGEPGVSEPLEYGDTEQLSEFFVGKVDPSGRTCQAIRFRRDIAFSEAYEYWPNGNLRLRTMSGPDQPQQVTHHDQEGRPVANPVLEPA